MRRILRRHIESGAYGPGDRFPTSRELRERYHVSTTTVEHALRGLAEQGLIYRKAGRGTVVSASPVTEELERLTGIPEAADAQGLEYRSYVLRAEFVQPTLRQAEALALGSGSRAFRLDRLVTIRRGEPIDVEMGVYPPQVGERLMEEPELMVGVLYRAMESRLGLHLDRASQTIGAVAAQRRQAELLGVPVGSPLVYFDRIVYLADGRPIQYMRCYFPAARYAFHVWLRRRDGEPPTSVSFGSSRLSASADFWDADSSEEGAPGRSN